ncbi:lipoyl amidotransferase LIPT1, mitochondrial [Onthophagus taurus]|uniref:lipoyl amidotransferase LIPT1, mitochondrial n=1 Tax=Onthophagus taurus TaxID=166361 RepID=UPI000C2006B0|nr:lipoyltransferase 1, mitochondrial-like [Onthophagus taurus]
MALARSKVNKITAVLKSRSIKKSVFISQSNDVYTNLALEQWLYQNFDFKDHHVMLLTKNDPSIVIGHTQNPWVETNIKNHKHLAENGVKLARRIINGTASYQDHGNLNATFFTSTQDHDSLYNMEILRRALFREYTLKTNLALNNDLMIRNYKVSNAASKIGDNSSYLHCSLLVNVNKPDLVDALCKTEPKTTMKYMNLSDENYKINVESLLSAIGWEFLRTEALTLKDGGKDLANQQKGFNMINPTEKWFPGLMEIRDELSKWDWNYGKTPNFTITRSFHVPNAILKNTAGVSSELTINMSVENGRIKGVTMFVPPGLSKSGFTGEAKVLTSLKGRKFSEDAINSLEYYLRGSTNDSTEDKFVSDCVRKVMTSF